MVRAQAAVKRSRSFLIFAGLFLLTLAAAYLFAWKITLTGFLRLEREEAEDDLSRCVASVEGEMRRVSRTTTDYAVWDDTYAFLQGGNPDYPSIHLRWSYQEATNGLNLIFLLRPDGEVVWGGLHDSSRGGLLSPVSFALSRFPPDHPFLPRLEEDEASAGLIFTEYGPLAFAAHHVLRSDETGPSAGILVMGSFLSERIVERLSAETRAQFRLLPAVDSSLSGRNVSLEEIRGGRLIVAEGPSRLTAFHLFPEAVKGTAVLLEADLPRHIYLAGVSTAHTLAALLLVSGLMVSLLIVLLMNRNVKLAATKRAAEEAVRVCDRELAARAEVEAELERQAEVQKKLARELDHRVRNNLTTLLALVHRAASRAKDAHAKDACASLARHIESLSAAHSLLAEGGWQSLNLERLCRAVVLAVINTRPDFRSFQLTVEPSGIEIPARVADHIALVLSELTVNSCKHSRGKVEDLRIDIGIGEDDESIFLEVRDNGPGFGATIRDEIGLQRHEGLRLVQGIVQHSLGGDVIFSNDGGAVVHIRMAKRVITFHRQPEGSGNVGGAPLQSSGGRG